jgi:hypothetical protein
MSLIAWYKFDHYGMDRDSSGNGYHGSWTGIYDVGKIDACVHFTTLMKTPMTTPISLTDTLHYNEQGMCFGGWFKFNEAEVLTRINDVLASSSYTTPTGNLLGEDHYGGMAITWSSSDPATTPIVRVTARTPTGSVETASHTMVYDTWVHYLLNWDRQNNTIYFYVNGEQTGSSFFDKTDLPSRNFLMNSKGIYGGSGPGTTLPLRIDDVRVYNHVLSEKEIKELAKAKVLHYTFDEFQEPTVNLIAGKTIATSHSKFYPGGVANGWEITGVANDNPRLTLTNGSTPLSPSTVYTFSALYWHSHNIVDDVYLQFAGTGYPEGGVYFQPFTSQTASLGGYYSIKDLGNGWKHCSGTFTTTANTTAINAIFFDSDTAGYVCFLGNIQLEQKSYATPFVNGTRTGSVSDNSEYKKVDSSGYETNAVLALATTPQWVEDSRIGKGAYKFDGADQRITSNLTSTQLASLTSCSISFWRKSSALASWIPFMGHSTEYYIMATSSGTGAFHHGNTGGAKSIYVDGAVSTTPSTDLTSWHHYVITDVDLSAWTAFIIGGYPGEWQLKGLLDDVRIYNTVLSADDVKELYNTRAQIDDRGNFFLNNVNQPAVVTDGLVGWWPLAGDTKDYSGFGNDGINNGAVSTTGVLGEADTAYQFTEHTDYISLPADTSLVKSISFWLKEDAVTDWLPFTGQSNSHYLMATSGGVGAFYHSNSGTPIIFRDSQETLYPAGDTSWHHYVATNIDISLWTEIRLSGYRTTNWPLEGKVSDVRFYNRILSSEEIEALYNMTEPLPAATRLHDNGIADFVDISEIGPAKGLVAYYPLNGNAKDYTNSNDGTVVGATIAAGINGKACYSFDGVSSHIRVDNYQKVSTGFSISLWAKKNSSWTSGDYRLVSTTQGGGFNFERTSNPTIDFYMYIGGGYRSVSKNMTDVSLDWHLFTGTWDGNLVSFYFDGVLVDTVGGSGVFHQPMNRLFIGSENVNDALSNDKFFDGLIQNVRIYNRALSLEEINILYDLEIGSAAKVKIDKDTVYLSGEIYEG